MTRKLITIALALVFLFSFFVIAVPRHAKAAPATPQATCSGCISDGIWEGNQHGIRVVLDVSQPSFRTTNAEWLRVITLDNALSSMDLGVVDCHSTCQLNTGCKFSGKGNGEFYFYDDYNVSGNLTAHDCQPVPGVDLGTFIQFQISFYVTNGPGMFFQIYSRSSSGLCVSSCAEKGDATTWPSGAETEEIKDTWSSGQVVGLSSWTGSAYQSVSDSNWHYQQRDFDVHVHRDPPQFYWHIIPNSSNNGGILYSCDLVSGSTC